MEARDQSQIEIFGPRVGSTITAHEICDEFVMGPQIAQTILQRELYVRTKFTFKLSWEYCLLDPMDVVTLTDADLGLSNCRSALSGRGRMTKVSPRTCEEFGHERLKSSVQSEFGIDWFTPN